MSEFIYQEPFPIECDKTQYRLLTKEYVKIVECDGRRILKVDPKGIELLARDSKGHTYYQSRKLDRVPREAVEELLGITFTDKSN